MKHDFPSVSIVIPTLNASSVLEKCLSSIKAQSYPKSKVEVIIADGGSTDMTLSIAKKYHTRIVFNKLKTGESGKAVGVMAAKGSLIALIDSDNILPDKNWLKEMTLPFFDEEIIVAEPITYTYRKVDPYLTRYFALLGMNDPICLFIGNYDRISQITGRWTDLHFPELDLGRYLKITLDHEPIPTIGANGTLIRTKILKQAIHGKKYLFDIDIVLKLIRDRGSVKIAKVKTGIIHTFVEDDPFKFFRKQLRRINDMSFHRAHGSRQIDWQTAFFWRVIWFQFQCLLVFPIIIQTIRGYLRKPDPAWLFHPVAVYTTWIIYLYGWLKGKIVPHESSRANWSQ